VKLLIGMFALFNIVSFSAQAQVFSCNIYYNSKDVGYSEESIKKGFRNGHIKSKCDPVEKKFYQSDEVLCELNMTSRNHLPGRFTAKAEYKHRLAILTLTDKLTQKTAKAVARFSVDQVDHYVSTEINIDPVILDFKNYVTESGNQELSQYLRTIDRVCFSCFFD